MQYLGMRKMTVIGSVVLALFAIAFVSAAERTLRLPQSVSFAVLLLLTQVLTYPVVEWWYERRGRRIAFRKWALGALVSSVTAALIHTLIVRAAGTS
jgi:uncharacterized membrane protein YjfL (UPF0719 family)